MATANFGVLYTQAGGGDIDVAYINVDNEFSVEQTFLDGIAIQGQATTNADASTANGLVRLSQAQALILLAIDGFNADGNTWDAPQVFNAEAEFTAGALFQNVSPSTDVDVTGSTDPFVIPNKSYVDAIVASAVGVRTDVENTFTAEQNFTGGVTLEGQVNVASTDPINIGSGGIESSGIIQTQSGLISLNSAENSIRGGDGQLGISADYTQYLVNNITNGYAVQSDYGTPNIIYTRSGSAIGINVGINLPSPTACLGKRLTFVAVKDPFQITGVIKNFDNIEYSNVVVAECATITLCALNVNGDCWYVLSHNGTIDYNV